MGWGLAHVKLRLVQGIHGCAGNVVFRDGAGSFSGIFKPVLCPRSLSANNLQVPWILRAFPGTFTSSRHPGAERKSRHTGMQP